MEGLTMKGLAIGLAVALVTAGSATAAFVVTSKNIKNGTIQLVDISPKAKKALRGQRGPQGLQGPQGIQAITEVQGPGTVIPPGQRGDAFAACPDGQQPIAGGFEAASSGMPGSGVTVTGSRRSGSSSRGWGVTAQNFNPTGTGLLFAYVYCSPNVTLIP
jgi:hypothetical protein